MSEFDPGEDVNITLDYTNADGTEVSYNTTITARQLVELLIVLDSLEGDTDLKPACEGWL
jgi:hypothetical protein